MHHWKKRGGEDDSTSKHRFASYIGLWQTPLPEDFFCKEEYIVQYIPVIVPSDIVPILCPHFWSHLLIC